MLPGPGAAAESARLDRADCRRASPSFGSARSMSAVRDRCAQLQVLSGARVVARVQTGDVQQAWDALFDALLAEHEEISRRVREALQAELPAYRSLPVDALDADVRIEVERVLGSARAGRSAVSEKEFAELVAVG